MLCEKCCNIHFKRIEDCDLIQQEPDRIKEGYSHHEISIHNCVFYFHHQDKQALKISAEQGCHFCAMLWDSLFSRPCDWLIQSPWPFARGEIVLRRSIDFKNMEWWNLEMWTQASCGSLHSMINGLIATMLKCLTNCTNISLSSSTEGSKQSNTALTQQEEAQAMFSPWLDTSTTSRASMVLASTWLRNCLRNHKPCQKLQSRNTLPNRIINIADPSRPFLASGEGREDRYVTLSYKWGQSHKYLTSTHNMDLHQNEIPLNDLPLTFRDAIRITRTLGFRWLWIDALCILQDNEDDKQREIGIMDQTFQRSTLTLFAAVGDSVDDGLSVTRDPRWVKPCRLNLKTSLDGKTVQGATYVTVNPKSSSAALFKRGWVLQEEVLATRGLVFGSSRLTWRCLCGHSTETNPGYQGPVETLEELSPLGSDGREYLEGWDGFNLLRLWLHQMNPFSDRVHWQRDSQYDHWYALVTNYSRRKLTYSSDVLNALSGLASAMAKTHDLTYVAGLWIEDLQIGLGWYLSDDPDHSDLIYCPLVETNLEAPSWSWISKYGNAIKFRSWQNSNTQVKEEGLKCENAPGQHQDPSLFPVRTFTSRHLTLTGRYKTAIVQVKQKPWYWKEVDVGEREQGRWVSTVKDAISGEAVGHIALDFDPEYTTVSLIYCLLCTVREKYGKWHLTGLGLVPTNKAIDEFSRVGLVFIRKENWFGYLVNRDQYHELPADLKDDLAREEAKERAEHDASTKTFYLV